MNKNVELNREKGKYSTERQQLLKEIDRLKKELEDLLQTNQDINGVLQGQISEFRQLESKYNDLLVLERCQDCVRLREEIEIYGRLLQGIALSKKMSSSSSSS